MDYEIYAHYFVPNGEEAAPPKVVQVDKTHTSMPGLLSQGIRPMPGLLPVVRENDEIPSVVEVNNEIPELVSYDSPMPNVVKVAASTTPQRSESVTSMLNKLKNTFATPRMPVSQSVDAANIAAGLKRGKQNVSHRQHPITDTLVS